MRTEWRAFTGGVWEREINVRDFIQKNYTPYDGDDTFLAGPTAATNELWAQVMFQLHLSAFGTQFSNRNSRSIVDDQLGISDDSDSFHYGIPVGIG